MKKQKLFLFIICIFIFSGCKKDKYEFYSTHVVFKDEGREVGQCGWVLVAKKDNNNYLTLKPIHIPPSMSINPNITYEAKIEVLPEKYECKYSGSNLTENESTSFKINFAEVLEFKEK